MNGPVVYSPSAFENNDGWTTPENAYLSNNSYASPGAKDDNVTYLTYNILVDPGEDPSMVEVGIEAYGDGNDFLEIEVSWDGGLSWTTVVPYTPPSSDPGIPTYVDLTDGRTWTWDELSNANFRVKITKKEYTKGNPMYLDWIPINITSTVAETRYTVNFDEVEITVAGEPGETNFHTVATGKKCRVTELTIDHKGTEKTVVKLLVGTEVKLRVPILPQTERVWSSALGRVFTGDQVIKIQGSNVIGGGTYVSGSGLEAVT